MDVVIAGASGFLGSHLTQRLRDRGHSVTRLVRHPARTGDESQWDRTPAGSTSPSSTRQMS